MKFEGSTVFACSLDAEGAFDAIPHSVLFQKCFHAVPTRLWRLLDAWYSVISVRVRWGGHYSDPIQVTRGTRQGGSSSPLLFNCFYQNVVRELNPMSCGIAIGRDHYNVLCYADDLLLLSLSTSGLTRGSASTRRRHFVRRLVASPS